jgi:hypothetical protein
MKRERRLHLVPPPSASKAFGDEPPFTEEELREADALREALDRGDAEIARNLRAAWAPAPIDGGDLDAILERALGSDEALAPPTRVELEAAARLRDDLARGEGLAEVKAAYRPTEITPERNEELIARALRRAAPRQASRVRRIVPVTMAALTGVAALAAGVALMIGQMNRAPNNAPAALIHARSTDDLFDPAKKFEVGEQSARIDRIATARASDLRQNRFAAWGVR